MSKWETGVRRDRKPCSVCGEEYQPDAKNKQICPKCKEDKPDVRSDSDYSHKYYMEHRERILRQASENQKRARARARRQVRGLLRKTMLNQGDIVHSPMGRTEKILRQIIHHQVTYVG